MAPERSADKMSLGYLILIEKGRDEVRVAGGGVCNILSLLRESVPRQIECDAAVPVRCNRTDCFKPPVRARAESVHEQDSFISAAGLDDPRYNAVGSRRVRD